MSSGFNVIRKHARDAASVRIKELAQELARQRSEIAGSQLETDDIRSQGRMDHSTIKLNDERLKFATTLSVDTDFFYEFMTEPDFDKLKVWFMMDHLGAKMRDISGFGNDAIIRGHPTLIRAPLNLGFQQTSASFGTPAMLFNSGTDVVSQLEGEYIWVPDHPSIQFTQFSAGFTLCLRFRCLDFGPHIFSSGGQALRRMAAKTDSSLTGHDVTTATDGWNLVVSKIGTTNAIEFQVVHNNIQYHKRATGFNTNSWYQLICTYDPTLTAGERTKMYVGGVLTGAATSLSTLFLPLHPNLRIGARDATSGFFKGYIHDFRMYMGKILTQTEITNLNTNEVTIDNIPKGHAFIVQYALVSQVMKLTRHRWNMSGRIFKFRTHKFNIIKKVTRTKTHKFSILTKVTRSKTHKFSTLQKVSRTRTHKFSMGGVVRPTKTHKYNILTKVTRSKTHKYNIGGLQTQYVRFQKSTTSGSNITQNVAFSSNPQAIIVWADGSTTDNTYSNGYGLYYGFSDGTNHACVSAITDDNVSTTNAFSGLKATHVISFASAPATVAAEATVSFSGNNAVFNWTTNNTSAYYIHCLAIWGINAAEVKTFTTGQTTTGNRTYSFTDTNIVPKLIHTLYQGSTNVWDTSFGNAITIGSATSSSKQWTVGNTIEDAKTAANEVYARGYYNESNVVVGLDDDTGNVESTASLVSFNTGNFVLNWTDAPPTSTSRFSVLCIDTGNAIDIGSFSEPAATGTQNIAVDPAVNTIKGLMVFSNGQSTSGVTTDAIISVGGASGTGATEQGVIGVGEDDTTPTASAKINKTGSVIKTISAAATATSSTTTSEAALSSLATQDQFTLNWSTRSGTRRNHYIVWGV